MNAPRNLPRSSLAALAAASLAALSGCGTYVSDYVPPADGRARAMWRDGEIVADVADIPSDCAAEVGYYSNEPPQSYSRSGRNVRVYGGFWVPVYYGPRIVVVHRGVAPAPRPVPIVRGTSSVSSVGSTGSGVPVVSSGGGRGGSGSGSSGGGSGGGSGSGDAAKLLVPLAVVALLTLPFVAIGLAAGNPESEKQAALSIDKVNAYNDLARTPGSPCSLYWQEAPAQ